MYFEWKIEEATLFRANNVMMTMFQVFSKMDGVRYLWDVLGSFLLELNVLSKNTTTSSSSTTDTSKSSSSGTNSSISLTTTKTKSSLMDLSINMEVSSMEIDYHYYLILLYTLKTFHFFEPSLPSYPSIHCFTIELNKNVHNHQPSSSITISVCHHHTYHLSLSVINQYDGWRWKWEIDFKMNASFPLWIKSFLNIKQTIVDWSNWWNSHLCLLLLSFSHSVHTQFLSLWLSLPKIDPSKIEQGQSGSVSINKYTLLLTTQKLFSDIVSSAPVLPKWVKS